MRRQFLALLIGALVVVLSAGVGLSAAAGASSAARKGNNDQAGAGTTSRARSTSVRRSSRRRPSRCSSAGKVETDAKVVRSAKGQYVELAARTTDKIFVAHRRVRQYAASALSRTGQRHQAQPPFDGPLHNKIPQPDRAVDNTTLWQPDYNKAHYENMYFNRMAEYYECQSSGRYSVDGDVTEWVKVPFNEARYGRD